ncbi:MAG: septal ring lytic transglycosylase RlpA family protein, partial [Parvibaculaceae bacterium]|nr:septal ring lytic transglycosylase RlpA family protein [Parvibaculaceae bacterium]
GEVFDQNSISAAHPTLPMPTIARVTNLENGRSLIVRVNDRGPFARGREIDLSRRSAELLGYRKQGTAKVRVQYLGRAPLYGEKMPARFAKNAPKESFVMPKAKQRDDDTLAPAIPSTPVQVATLGAAMAPTANAPAVTGQVEQTVVPPISDLFVQAGAFSSQGNADLVRQQLAPLGDATVTPINVNGRTLYRVRVGPVESVESADTVLSRVVQQGHKGARIIVD